MKSERIMYKNWNRKIWDTNRSEEYNRIKDFEFRNNYYIVISKDGKLSLGSKKLKYDALPDYTGKKLCGLNYALFPVDKIDFINIVPYVERGFGKYGILYPLNNVISEQQLNKKLKDFKIVKIKNSYDGTKETFEIEEEYSSLPTEFTIDAYNAGREVRKSTAERRLKELLEKYTKETIKTYDTEFWVDEYPYDYLKPEEKLHPFVKFTNIKWDVEE